MEVELTPYDIQLCEFVAQLRNNGGIAAAADAHKYGHVKQTLALHVIGCLGELAFAKAMNRFWSGAGDHYYEDSDVGRYQIRATTYATGRLLIRPNETHLDVPWVLVVQMSPTRWRIAGWLYGREAHRPEYLDSPAGRPAAYFVPQHRLRPISSLQLAA